MRRQRPIRGEVDGDVLWRSTMPSILFVDDEVNVLRALERALHGRCDGWNILTAQSADEALERARVTAFDAIVTDVTMPGRDGLELLTALQAQESTREIPVIILTGLSDVDLKRRALELGAVDLLNKPIITEDLIARLRSALRIKSQQDQLKAHNKTLERRVRERTAELEQSRVEIILRLAKAGEYRDEQTGDHVLRVGASSRALAERLGMRAEFCDTIALTSPLHDIGKIGIPDAILLKNGSLSPAEWTGMKRHCEIGYEILQQDPMGLQESLRRLDISAGPVQHRTGNTLLKQAALIALCHHERWDGNGYPNGLAGARIPLEARIVCVADVYDALSHARPYKPAFPEDQVISIMTEESSWRFDPDVFEAFLQIKDVFRAIRLEHTDAAREAA